MSRVSRGKWAMSRPLRYCAPMALHPAVRGAPGPAGAGPARGRDGAARTGAVRGAGRVAARRRRWWRGSRGSMRHGDAGRSDLRGHVQQARRRGAGGAAGRRRSSRSGSRRARCGSGRSTPSGARSCGRPGVAVEPLVDRVPLLRRLFPAADRARLRQLDDLFCRLKLDRGLTLEDVARADPTAHRGRRGVRRLRDARSATSGGLDFDDLVVRALRAAATVDGDLATVAAACRELLVDEVQDVDRTQLRLALHPRRARRTGSSSSATTTSRSTAGDSPTCGASSRSPTRCPACARIDLVTNYRCPAPGRAARRAADRARTRSGSQGRPARDPRATGLLVLAPDRGRRRGRAAAIPRRAAGRRGDAGGPRPDEPRADAAARDRAGHGPARPRDGATAARGARRWTSCSRESRRRRTRRRRCCPSLRLAVRDELPRSPAATDGRRTGRPRASPSRCSAGRRGTRATTSRRSSRACAPRGSGSPNSAATMRR